MEFARNAWPEPARDADLRTLAFRLSASSRRCCSIRTPTRSSTPIRRPAPCSATTARLLRETRISALHAGQLPALIVFTQAVLDKGAYWTNALTPRHATGQPLRLEYAGSRLPHDGRSLMLLTMSDLEQRRRRYRRCHRRGPHAQRPRRMAARRAGVPGHRAREPADPARRRRRHLRRQRRGQDHLRQSGGRAHARLDRRGTGRPRHAPDRAPHPSRRHRIIRTRIARSMRRSATAPCIKVDNEVFWRKDGTSFWVEYTSTPIRDRGIVVGAVIVFRDVTQRREADEKLRAALDEVDRLRERLELENAYLQEEIRIEGNQHGIIGHSAAIQKTLRQVELVAPTDATVLITGESGTGKELIARAIHEASAPPRPAADPRQLRGDPARTVRERILRPRQGRLHRRAARPHRPVRAGRRRHAVSRRGRRNSARAAGQAAARAAGRQFRARRRGAHPHRRCARDRRHQPRPQAGGAARPLPRGPLFPAQRVSDRVGAAARAPRRHSAAGRAFPDEREPQAQIRTCG